MCTLQLFGEIIKQYYVCRLRQASYPLFGVVVVKV